MIRLNLALNVLLLSLFTATSPAHAARGKACASVFSVETAKPSAQDLELRDKARKQLAKIFRVTLTIPSDLAAQVALAESMGPVTLEELIKYEPYAAEVVRNRVISEYVRYARKFQREPKPTDIAADLALSEAQLLALLGENRIFADWNEVDAAARRKTPSAFRAVVEDRFTSREALARIEKVIEESPALLITTAVAFTPVSEHAIESLKAMAREKKAAIIVLPAFMQTTGLSPRLLDDPDIHILVNTTLASKYLAIANIKLMPKMQNPLARMEQYGPRGQSIIVATPQIRLKSVPTIHNDDRPHVVMGTGAISDNIYNSIHPIQGRTDFLASDERRHNMGALLLEKSRGSTGSYLPKGVVQTGFHHFRHTHYVKGRGFVDKTTLYTPDGSRPTEIEALILPDIHVGMTDPLFLTKVTDAIRTLRPKRIIIHDVFNGHSISHHEAKNMLSAARNYVDGKLDLKREIEDVVTFINSLLSLDPKLEVAIIRSNHDDWIHRWLNTGEFMKETHNRAIGIQLAAAFNRGEDPFEFAMREYGLEYPKRVEFVTQGSFVKAGVELGQHGHQGANGGPNSTNTMKTSTDKSVNGHVHYSEIDGHTVVVGTGSLLRPGYTGVGASSWNHSIAAVSEPGVTQLFILQRGEWWGKEEVAPDSRFFAQGYPHVVPLTDSALGQSIDQWSHRMGPNSGILKGNPPAQLKDVIKALKR